MQILLRASLCGTEEERYLAMTEARLRIGILFQIPMSEVRIDLVHCPAGAEGERNLGDLKVTCKAETTEPAARYWQVVAAWEQPGFVAVQELRFFADAGCTSPLPSPRLPSQATEALAASSRGSVAAMKAYDGNSSTAFAHRCSGVDCVVLPGEAYLEVRYDVPQTVGCVQIDWTAPKLGDSSLSPLWVLRRRQSAANEWIDSGIWRGTRAPDSCHGVECGAFGVCQPPGNGSNASCECFEGFRGQECDNHTKKASVSPEIFDNVPDTSIPHGHFEQHYYIRRPEDCGDLCLADYNCESWAYSPWSESCRTGTWARSASCRQPLADLGWGFFEKHRGQIRIPYYPTSDNTCGVNVPDEVLSSGPHIVSLRIITARLGQDEASLRATLANLETKLENLLGFPSLLLSSSVADSSERPSNLLPVGHRVGLRSSEDRYFGLDAAGSWSFEFNATSERHVLEVLDVGDGNVALRSVASPFHYLEAVISNGTVVCGGSSSLPSNSHGFRFRAKELPSSMGERNLMLVSVDFGVVLAASASGSCSWRRWEELGSNISADDPVLVVQDVSDAAAADVVDQDGREISSADGVQTTTDWFSIHSGSGPNASWLQIPLSWEGVTAPPLMGKLLFGVWEQPIWVSPDGPGDRGSEDSDGGQPGENPGDDGVDPGSWQDWSSWQSANPSSDGSGVNRTRLVIEVHYEGPFHPLPTWLGSCLSALLAVMIIGTVAYYFRGHWQCRKSKVVPVPSQQPTQWAPSGQEKNTWAPRVGGEEVVQEGEAP
ncbi:unnamed protein product, partial [Symbiodinium sp. CCMP2592]